MDYYRPETIKQALRLLEKGIPLAGGTVLTPNRYQLEAVIDLQDLGLEGCELKDDILELGAMTRLQDLLQWDGQLPQALNQSVQQESGLNLRNMVTVGGLIMSADARSPVLTALIALKTKVVAEPGGKERKLDKILAKRFEGKKPFILTTIRIPMPSRSAYASVARSPADFPLLSAAAAVSMLPAGGREWVVALGGYGSVPERKKGELDNDAEDGPSAMESAAAWATKTYAHAGDPFASAEYRADVGAVLVRRVLKEVLEG